MSTTSINPQIVRKDLVLHWDPSSKKSYQTRENLITTKASFNYPFSVPGSISKDLSPFYEYVDAKVTTGSSNTFMDVAVDTPLSVGTYTISSWIRGEQDFVGSFAFIGETFSGNIYSTNVSITKEWKRVTHTFFLAEPQNNSRVQWFFSSQAANKTFSIYGVQLNRGSTALPYTETVTNGTPLQGSSELKDTTILPYQATLENNPAFSLNNGGVFEFNGTNNFIDSNFELIANQALTLCVWVYPKDRSDIGDNFIFLIGGGSKPELRVTGSGQIRFDGNITTPGSYNNEWHYICIKKPELNGTPEYYIDGEYFGTEAPYTINNVTPNWFTNTFYDYDGNIGAVQVYNRALDAAEIRQNFLALRGRFGV